jgi:hypothetical protein
MILAVPQTFRLKYCQHPEKYIDILPVSAMKGKMKRRLAGSQFQKKNGDQIQKKQSPRHQKHQGTVQESQPEPGPSSKPDLPSDHSTIETQTAPNLRPREKPEIEENNEKLGNRIVDLQCVIDAMNEVIRGHQKFPAHCRNPDMVLHKERKIGLGSDLKFACQHCEFVSRACRTYKPCVGKSQGAAINMLLASALQDTSIGVEKANILLTSMDIAPPARSRLQHLVNAATINTVTLNDSDMANKRQLVIRENRARGASDPKQIDLSLDARYNANRLVSSYKPGQGASQAYAVAIENNTSFKYIVGLAIENKLCWTGAYLRNKGYEDIKCPGEHLGCTANIEYMQPHSERRMAYSIAQQMHKEDLMIRTLTTDGDTKSFLGAQDFYNELEAAWNVTRQADPNHLGSSQIRRARKANWSVGMFPGKSTRPERQQATAAFAKDIKSRCAKIISSLRVRGDGDLLKELKCLPDVCASTIECYAGNCSYCPHQSIVCSGVGGVGDWWFHSEFLPTHDIHSLKMTTNDKVLLRTILEVRLSESAVISVSSNTNTQKCEAFNRGALSSLPKEVNHSKNFAGRLASKTLQLNNSLQSAIETKVATITGQKLSSRASRYLTYVSKKAESRKQSQKSAAFKAKRRKNRARLEHDYHIARSGNRRDDEVDYVKGQLDGLH